MSRAVLTSFVVFIASHIVNPGFYSLFPAGERTCTSDKLLEGVDFRAGWLDHRAAFLHHKLDAVAGFQPKALANLLWNGDLAFAADFAGVFHLYSRALQSRIAAFSPRSTFRHSAPLRPVRKDHRYWTLPKMAIQRGVELLDLCPVGLCEVASPVRAAAIGVGESVF